MKVLLINGSPNAKGCTFTALSEVEKELNKEGIETEIIHVGHKDIRGCIGCRVCKKTGKCVFDDIVNEESPKFAECDGIVIGSPVYYAGPNGALCALLDRVFYQNGGRFSHKPGAAVISCRRSGSTASFDRLNKYFTISGMPVVSSTYWNAVHGNSPEEVRQDKEGLHTMRTLARNMAWMLKAIENEPKPVLEEKEFTNFIRPFK